MKNFFKKHELIIKYLFFGIATTFVGWAVYFAVLFSGRAIFSIPTQDTASAKYFALYSAAQVIQWVIAVLFAFFTNRRWVFTDYDRSVPIARQLGIFASGRVLTFFLDYGVTFFGAILLGMMLPAANCVLLFGKEFNLNEMAAKVVAAVIVIIGNYFFSKILVFGKKKENKIEKDEK